MGVPALSHEAAFRASRQVVQVFAPLLREEEQADAMAEVYPIVRDALRAFAAKLDRESQRLAAAHTGPRGAGVTSPEPVYRHDGLTVFHGDCRAVMPTLAAASVDLVLTDPPYLVGFAVHPNQKPVATLLPLLASLCPPGGLVLDPFMGSGSPLVAAHTLGLPAVGIEVDAAYCQAAIRRLDQGRDRQPTLFIPSLTPDLFPQSDS